MIYRNAPLERLLRIHQALDRQGFRNITNNIFAEKHGILSLRD